VKQDQGIPTPDGPGCIPDVRVQLIETDPAIWRQLELVSRRPAGEATPPARLIDGARRGPLEDSGGFPGYEELLDAWLTEHIRSTPTTWRGWPT
jgi:hypothetical protein